MDLLEGLNPAQREAVLHPSGPLLVLAGAGSGKTLVLTRRVAYLVKERGVPPSSILAITFTNKAAGEMKERIRPILSGADGLWIGTFHSIGLRILRMESNALGLKRDFSIYDERERLSLIRECMRREGIEDELITPERVASYIEAMKNDAIAPEDVEPSGHLEERLLSLYRVYEDALRKNSAVDFGNLILLPLRLFRENPAILSRYRELFQHVLVDEFQDTNLAQYQLIRLLLNGERNLWVVGDDDQSIYGWRGARVRNILDLERDFPDLRVIRLEENYRSTGTILGAANSVIRNNTMRRGKTLWTRQGEGEKVTLAILESEEEEANWVGRTILDLSKERDLGEFAIFYRTNAQSRVLEEALLRSGIPYEILGGTRFYERAEIKDIIAYLRVILNPEDSQSLLRVINQPPRGIGRRTIELTRAIAERDSLSLFDAILKGMEEGVFRGRGEGVRLFVGQISQLQGLLCLPPFDFLERLLHVTGLLAMWEDKGEEGRVENIKEFLSAAKEFEEDNPGSDIRDFLDHLSLVSDIDSYDQGRGKVALMTIHSAKGLEFPVVFMTGMEEGLFPHGKAVAEGDVEEERRLCYVGMTRAKERLFLSAARRRRIFGKIMEQRPSRFLDEVDRHYLRLYRVDAGPEGGSFGPVDDRAFSTGDLVEHPAFGRGKVLGMKGRDVLIVSFHGAGLKKLKVPPAPLKKVG